MKDGKFHIMTNRKTYNFNVYHYSVSFDICNELLQQQYRKISVAWFCIESYLRFITLLVSAAFLWYVRLRRICFIYASRKVGPGESASLVIYLDARNCDLFVALNFISMFTALL